MAASFQDNCHPRNWNSFLLRINTMFCTSLDIHCFPKRSKIRSKKIWIVLQSSDHPHSKTKGESSICDFWHQRTLNRCFRCGPLNLITGRAVAFIMWDCSIFDATSVNIVNNILGSRPYRIWKWRPWDLTNVNRQMACMLCMRMEISVYFDTLWKVLWVLNGYLEECFL